MRAVGVKALKDKLSAYLRLVANGEVVLVTDRDRVVAELRPPEPGRATWVSDACLAEAFRQGLIRPAAMRHGPLPKRHPVAPTKAILEELEQDRGDR